MFRSALVSAERRTCLRPQGQLLGRVAGSLADPVVAHSLGSDPGSQLQHSFHSHSEEDVEIVARWDETTGRNSDMEWLADAVVVRRLLVSDNSEALSCRTQRWPAQKHCNSSLACCTRAYSSGLARSWGALEVSQEGGSPRWWLAGPFAVSSMYNHPLVRCRDGRELQQGSWSKCSIRQADLHSAWPRRMAVTRRPVC